MQLYPSTNAGPVPPQPYHHYHHLHAGHLYQHHEQQHASLSNALLQPEIAAESTGEAAHGLMFQHPHLPLSVGPATGCRTQPSHPAFVDLDRNLSIDFHNGGGGHFRSTGASAVSAMTVLQSSATSSAIVHPVDNSSVLPRSASFSHQSSPSVFATGPVASGEWMTGNDGVNSSSNGNWYIDQATDGSSVSRSGFRLCGPTPMSTNAARQYAAYLQAAAGYGPLPSTSHHRMYADDSNDEVIVVAPISRDASLKSAEHAFDRLLPTASCATVPSGEKRMTSSEFPLTSTPSAAVSAGGSLPPLPLLKDSRTIASVASPSERPLTPNGVLPTTSGWKEEDRVGSDRKCYNSMFPLSIPSIDRHSPHRLLQYPQPGVRCYGSDRMHVPDDRNNNALKESTDDGVSNTSPSPSPEAGSTTMNSAMVTPDDVIGRDQSTTMTIVGVNTSRHNESERSPERQHQRRRRRLASETESDTTSLEDEDGDEEAEEDEEVRYSTSCV